MNGVMKTPFFLKGIFPYFGSVILHGSLIGALIFQGESEKERGYQAPLPSIPVVLLSPPPPEKEPLQEEKTSPKPLQEAQASSETVTKDTFTPKKEIFSEKKIKKPANLKKISSVQNKKKNQSPLKKTKEAPLSAGSFGEEVRLESSPLVDLPKAVYAPKPSYPLIARRKKWEGRVSVRLFVDQDGGVYETHLVSSSSHEILDEAVLKALKKWRFPKVCGSCEPRSYTVPVSFFLKDYA